MSVRTATMHGREFYVAPCVLMVEGVHNGSGGPYFYPGEEFVKTAHLWNGKPVVIFHPFDGNTAARPEQWERQTVGVVFNARYDRNKLTAELWIDRIRLTEAEHGYVIQRALETNQTLEVSTGLYTVNDPVDGIWNGEQYEGIARHHVPDHLALLPGKTGACSIADGCGMNVNETSLLVC